MMWTRIYWRLIGGHVHARWFTRSESVGSYALNGELTFTEKEWFAMWRFFKFQPEVFELIEEEG